MEDTKKGKKSICYFIKFGEYYMKILHIKRINPSYNVNLKQNA